MSRRWRLVVSGSFFILALLAGAGVGVLRSGWLREQVRGRLIEAAERATGGRVELGGFDFDWRSMTASVGPFVVHGTEGAAEAPLLRADRMEVGLRVVSLFRRKVDLAFLTVAQPRVAIRVGEDGRTNVPSPKGAFQFGELLDLKVKRLTVTGGFVSYNERRYRVDGQAEGVSAKWRYEPKGPVYTAEVESRAVRLDSPSLRNAVMAVSATMALERDRLTVAKARVEMGGSWVDVSGVVSGLASPKGVLELKAGLLPKDLRKPLGLPATIADAGEVRFQGGLSLGRGPWGITGHASGRGLRYQGASVRIGDIRAEANVRADGDSLRLSQLAASLLGGEVRGRVDVPGWRRMEGEGEVRGLAVGSFAPELAGVTVSGSAKVGAAFRTGGLRDLIGEGRMSVVGGGLDGWVEGKYDQRTGTVELAVKGSASGRPELGGGSGRFDGKVSGPVARPEVAGRVDLAGFVFEGEKVDRLEADVEATESEARIRNGIVTQGVATVRGDGRVGLSAWKIGRDSPITGKGTFAGVDARRLTSLPVTGLVSGAGQVRGTYGALEGSGEVDAANVIAYGESIPRLQASVAVMGDAVRVTRANLTLSSGSIRGAGVYRAGRVQFDLAGRGVNLAKVHHIQEQRAGVGGTADFSAAGTGHVDGQQFRVDTIEARGDARQVSLDDHAYGELLLTAHGDAGAVDLRATARLPGVPPIEGSGRWKLEGDDPGTGEITIPRITVAALHALIPHTSRTPLPFEGFVSGKIALEGPLRKPDQMKAAIRIDALQLNASASATPKAGAQLRDLVLRNARPIELEATTKGVEIRSVQLTGTDTTLEAMGKFSFGAKDPLDLSGDLRFKGTVNLAALQMFNPNLLGSGVSVVDATVRGALTEPQVEGRLELRNASLFVTDLPNGLNQANGVILFDRSRATVDSLTATTGGGRVTLSKGSFLGFRGPALLYRVQGAADHVRYRSPEGVSITVNAALSLIGTSDSSVLAGTVTVVRAGFNPTTDVGGLLASTARPISTPSQNEYLKGMQFDVKVESAPSLEIQTSLARNIEAEGNVRVRGTPERPVVLGNLTVHQGEIEFFGSKYTINRGAVIFANAAKIEPTIDMDLETVVRGITVDITFSGPLSKLNFSYRSDPPLQTNDIIALLAVGRTPATTAAASPNQTQANANYLSTGSNALLSQAISAPSAGRLQRFFGVSHIKIDPQVTDLSSVPQARLTLEQQISKDITLTYITNLTRTQEQIVRVEWDVNRQWSVVALRDENGAFGIDVQFRKRFK